MVIVVVELPEMPDDESQKHKSCVWNMDELITVGA